MRHEGRFWQAFPDEPNIVARVDRALADLERPSLRRVINATGVVLHTNLGRAPLGPLSILPGYSNLEYDVAAGRRGKRDVHTSALLERLRVLPAIAVNNNAAAVFLALHELAAGGEAIVSRGELIEIGDGFRIPDIMAHSGATLCEIGTTNRTRIDDYRAAINERTRLLLRVHPSNFRISGFTARPNCTNSWLSGGSAVFLCTKIWAAGALSICEPSASTSRWFPTVCRPAWIWSPSVAISYSADRRQEFWRAARIWSRDSGAIRYFARCGSIRSIYQALENTLRSLLLEQWDAVPALSMLRQGADQIRRRALAFVGRAPGFHAEVIEGKSVTGGGATPEQSIPTWVIALDCANVVESERTLRAGDPPIVARIENERLIFDLRTVFPDEEDALLAAVTGLA